jgi:hypothetical protein
MSGRARKEEGDGGAARLKNEMQMLRAFVSIAEKHNPSLAPLG